jgi:ATP synthase F0 subunit b
LISNPLIILLGVLMAAGSEDKGWLWNPLLWQGINLAIFLVFLVYVLRKKLNIGKVFDDRAATIVKELDRARREKEEAEERLKEVEARLSLLDQEVAEMKAEAEAEAQREAERIKQSGQADAEKIRQFAQREIDGSMKAALNELRAFVADKSVELAEGIIRREISPQDNSRLLSKYVDELSEVNK